MLDRALAAGVTPVTTFFRRLLGRKLSKTFRTGGSSVADPDPNPDPDPPDQHVFGPPGSGSTSQTYRYGSGSGSCSGSGSGSFHHHAKIVRKTWIPTIL